MPFFPNSASCPKKLSSEYQLYACGNFFGHSLILEKIAILGQPPRIEIAIEIAIGIESAARAVGCRAQVIRNPCIEYSNHHKWTRFR